MKGLSALAIITLMIGTLLAGSLVEAVDERVGAKETLATGFPCRDERPDTVVKCQEMEQAILASTLRITLESWILYLEGIGYVEIQADGHATVKEGRYLVSHNHFRNISPAVLVDEALAPAISITLYRTDGQELLEIAATSLKDVIEDGETLIFDFGPGFFETLGVPSAHFIEGQHLALGAGLEVAQVDWDGTATHVEWVGIDEIVSDGESATLVLDNCVMRGASGGGVFWNGSHIANNMSRSTGCQDESGAGPARYTRAALNPASAAG